MFFYKNVLSLYERWKPTDTESAIERCVKCKILSTLTRHMPVWGEHVPLVPGGDADDDAALGAGATVQQGDAVQGEEEED